MGVTVAAPSNTERLLVSLSVSPDAEGRKDIKVVTLPRPILSPVGLIAFGQYLVRELCPKTFDPQIDFHTQVAAGLTLDSGTASALFPEWCLEPLKERPPEQWSSIEVMAMAIVGGLIAVTPGWSEAIRCGSVRAVLDTEDPVVASIRLSFKRKLHPIRLRTA